MRRSIAVLAACSLTAAALPASALARERVAVKGAHPSWATTARRAAAVPAAQHLSVTVYLALRDGTRARALARAISDPRSARYGHYLSNAAFTARFAPTQASLRAVAAWLRGQGLHVDGVAPNRTWLTASGTAAAAARTFGTTLALYRVDGATRRAATRAVTVPASLRRIVLAVGGLSQTGRMRPNMIADAPPSPAFVNAPPCSLWWAEKLATGLPTAFGGTQPYAPCGYTPAQLQGAYGTTQAIRRGNDGRGATVAFTDAYDSANLRRDVDTYSARHGLPRLNGGAFVDISRAGLKNKPNDDQNCGDWYGEQTLDLEAIHAMAPGARIVYSGGEDCFDSSLLAALHKLVDRNRAQIISNSWGDLGEVTDPVLNDAYDQLFVQAALKGIGIYYSSGDNGDEVATIGDRQPDSLANDPYVTAVGGTSLAVGRGSSYLFETGWSTGKSALSADGKSWTPSAPGAFLYGGGGGTSRVYGEPWYQKGVVPSFLANWFGKKGIPGGGRVVPDVAMVGDPTTGMLVGQTQTFADGSVRYSEYRIGGTSLSSPLFAGVMALADQYAGRRHGFANPALYAAAGTSAYRDVTITRKLAAVRHDYANGEDASGGFVTSLRSINDLQSLHILRGYDDTTGVGTPHGTAFLQHLRARR